MKLTPKKRSGFTLIEIVIVLAIAALIMVIVFIAVQGAQRARRDTQRRNDNARIGAQLESWASSHSGDYPTAAQFTGVFATDYLNGFRDPNGQVYTYGIDAIGTTACATGGVGGLARPTSTTPGAGVTYNVGSTQRGYTVRMCLENGDTSITQ